MVPAGAPKAEAPEPAAKAPAKAAKEDPEEVEPVAAPEEGIELEEDTCTSIADVLFDYQLKIFSALVRLRVLCYSY